MKEIIDKKECTGCMACANICSKNAINIQEYCAFQYPIINEEICINCGLCRKVCPIINNIDTRKYEIEVYACKNKDDEIKLKSSSGGIFTLIAEEILEQGGTVFGARFNEELEVIHDYITKKEDIERFRGSKYVQSKIGDTYKNVKKILENGSKVLFTGTPCQVGGLVSFLGKKYDNLYTQDIICHGVPSPKLWKKYLKYLQDKKSSKIKNVNFRRKDLSGWNTYKINYIYDNKEENISHESDVYLKFFLKNLCLRESCYNCKFKSIYRISDITLADFWGIEDVKPEFYDNKGVSVFIINSNKGKEMFEKIKNRIEYENADINDIIKYNPCICDSVQYNSKREEFFLDLENIEFNKLINKYLND